MGMLLRPLVVPTASENGGIVCELRYISVNEDNTVVKDEAGKVLVAHREEFRIMPDRFGCGYVSQVGFEAAECPLPAFFLDQKGLRHFVVSAERGDLPMFGQQAGMKQG